MGAMCSVSTWGVWSACDHECNAVQNTSSTARIGRGAVSCYKVRARKAAGAAHGCVIPILHQARVCRKKVAPRVPTLRRRSEVHVAAVSTAEATASRTVTVATTPVPAMSFDRARQESLVRQPTMAPMLSPHMRREQWRRRGLILVLTCVCAVYIRIVARWAHRTVITARDGGGAVGVASGTTDHDAAAWRKSLKQGGTGHRVAGDAMNSYMQYHFTPTTLH